MAAFAWPEAGGSGLYRLDRALWNGYGERARYTRNLAGQVISGGDIARSRLRSGFFVSVFLCLPYARGGMYTGLVTDETGLATNVADQKSNDRLTVWRRRR